MNFLAAILFSILATFPTVRSYMIDRGPTKDLSSLTNADCADIYGIDSTMTSFIKQMGIQGATLAVMKDNRLLYAKGYGWADKEQGIKMEPSHLMRIASASKLLTAVGIMKLCEEGKLSLSDRVFRPEGVLGKESFTSNIRDRRMLNITVEHLLRHKSGFTSKVSGDPLFGTDLKSSGREIISREMGKMLDFAPGSTQEYSNVGYYILSMIIEKVTGEKYDDWMLKHIFFPCQCYNFSIAGNSYAERLPGEVHYYMYPGADVPDKCYRCNNVQRLSGAGAWVSSAPDLCRLVSAIDGNDGLKDILSKESVARMTEYFDSATFPLGWVDSTEDGVWTRTGSFAGTSAIIKNFSADGDCWVLLTNTSTRYSSRISRFTSSLIKSMRAHYLDKLGTKDLFYD